MPPTLRQVVALDGLGLRLVNPADDALDRPVRWVAVSELEDPTPFLEGGELILTTGMRLSSDDHDVVASYVGRLVDCGAAALGLGIGLTHACTPSALVEVTQAAGLPLLEVPVDTPFIAITKAVSRLIAAEEYDAMQRAYDAQREMTRSALRPGGVAQVVSLLARQVDGHAAVLDPHGRVLHASADGDSSRGLPDLSDAVAELRRRGAIAAAALDVDGKHVVLQPLGTRPSPPAYLAVMTTSAPTRDRASLVAVAVSLLTLAIERASTDAREELRVALLHALVAGVDASSLPLDAAGLGWATTGHVRVVLLDVADGASVDLTDADHLLAQVDGATLLLVDDGRSSDEASRALRDAGRRAGGSAPVGIDGIPGAVDQAQRALAGSRSVGVTWFDRLAGQGLVPLIEPDAASGFVESMLGPLDARERGDLVRSLGVWLSHNGQWDAAATELGIHRHTLRYRMTRVEEVLGRSLDDAGLRAELWVALELRRLRPDGPSTT